MGTPAKFENVKEGNTVSLMDSGKKLEGIVTNVTKRAFTVTVTVSYSRDGITYHIYDRDYHFFKSGVKSRRNSTHGDAIEITTNFK